jgi:hypothetical protein
MKRRVEQSSQWAGRIFWLALVLIVVIVTSGSGSAQGQGQSRGRSIFTPIAEADTARPPQPERGKKRGRRVRANVAAVTAGDAAGADDILTLNLFDDAEFRARRRGAIERPRAGASVWSGQLIDMPGEATIAVNGDVMAGTVFADDRLFEIIYAGNGEHEVRELDPSQFPTDDPPFDGDIAPDVPGGVAADGTAVAGDAAGQIDVMVVWTPAARAAAGGTAAIQSVVDLAVANTNTSYANSNVTQRIRLVYAGEISYTETGTSTDLPRLTSTSDGFLDSVHSMRNTYGADIVTLLGEGYAAGGSCGIGYLMTTVSTSFATYAFNVVDRTCAAGNLSYAHELGHNMGLHHDPAHASGAGAYSYAYGYQEPSGAFRTVMAYQCPTGSCPRLTRFSNPSLSYNGMPTGTSNHNNALALNNTASTVANLRQAVGGSCTYSLGASSTTVSSGSSSSSVAVTAGPGCAWAATSNVGWVTITSGSPGTANGSVGFSVQANTAGTARAGALTIAGKTFTVNQAAAACGAFSLSPASQSVGASGGAVSVNVTGTTGCTRSATSNASWITVTAGASGTGTGTVSLSVTANTAGTSRTGTVTVGGQTFTVNQAAVTCGAFSLSSASQTVGASGGAVSVNVTGTTGCPRSATSNASWISVTAGASGTGTGTVSLSVAANTAGTNRTGTVTIAGQTFTVYQSAATCGAFSLSPASQTVGSTGGAVSVNVTGTTGCPRSATSNASWITVAAGASGTGTGTVSLNVAANTAGTSRTGTATIGGKVFSVTQSAAPCGAFSLSPASQNVGAVGGAASTSVTGTTGCARTATSNASWITVTGGATGSGSGTVSTSVAANTLTTTRTGTVTIGGQTFTIMQAAAVATCSYSISPASTSVGSAAGSGSFTLTTQAGCAATAVTTASWITITSGATGTGSRTVGFTFAANAGNQRTGAITVGGRTFSISQSKRNGKPANAAKADFSGDQLADLLWQHADGTVALWTMNGVTATATQFLTPARVDPAWRMIGSGDLDGNGAPEIVWQHRDGWLLAWFMSGTSAAQAVYLTPNRVDAAWKIVGLGDFNGDLRADLVWQHDSGMLAVWYMNGTTSTGSSLLSPSSVGGTAWQVVGVGDINGDLKTDLVWQESSSGLVGAWLMNGVAASSFVLFSPSQVDPATWRLRGVIDLDDDGRTDLLWQSTNGSLVAWMMQGTTAATVRSLNPAGVGSGWRLVGPR